MSQHFSFSAFRRRALFAALGAVLLGAVALVIYGETRTLERTFHGSVKDLLPKPEEIPGWTVQYLPIADTPEMQAKVSEILNYDDAVYAVYTKGQERISIYIAYWSPGKMSHRLIATHTPDRCWVLSGWRITENETLKREFIDKASGEQQRTLAYVRGPFSRIGAAINGFSELPIEWRIMEKSQRSVPVMFWHIVDGDVVRYSSAGRGPWYSWIMDAIRFKLRQKSEQFFLRVSL